MRTCGLAWALLLVCGAAASAGAEEKAVNETPDWMKKFEPGKEHAALKKLEGTYEVAVKMWMAPDKAPMESKASAEFKIVMNGRYLKQEYKGEMMGKPFIGVGYLGYDRTLDKYTNVWIDDASTQMMGGLGMSKDGGKTIEFTSERGDPMTNQAVKVRYVQALDGDDKIVFTMYETHGEKEIKGMELTYTRKK